jgi:hypothetical protein
LNWGLAGLVGLRRSVQGFRLGHLVARRLVGGLALLARWADADTDDLIHRLGAGKDGGW